MPGSRQHAAIGAAAAAPIVGRLVRAGAAVTAAAGACLLLWVALVWLWQDPFTALYTGVQQHRLEHEYRERKAGFHPLEPAVGGSVAVAAEARRYRLSSRRGEAMGVIRIPRLGLDAVVVEGADHRSLMGGPGFYAGDFLPGEGQLVYIAGHRTTYSAPFSRIERLRRGDRVTIELPYGSFVYVITGHRIVPASDLAVLRSHGHEQLILQACHPRFSATHRYLAYARLRWIKTSGRALSAAEAAAGGGRT
jgi:sortase A